ncbi:putative ABC transporter ATP-binding protein YheS [Candidatus Izimaplasma bacterium HR1]|jgi:ATP-binding cassette subfamily F protein 3|uniref:ABC-F family ATP-binding cassette domain-containing protein n=1 Tax=Candidatus Izimoplasma sp. HR1 TaxID=1541959 RepID=UPI0004F8874E|nr:putative ABC transporter ATP-binding protein YheS [Candidatus Izimaplasma bacterium HR1]
MNILSISKLQKEFSGEVLFRNISFDINSKDKIAIIGKNGTGKSTLLKMITGEESIDSGEIHKNQRARVGYLSQSVIKNSANTLYEEMLEVFKDVIKLEERLNSITAQLESNPHDEDLINTYAKMEHSYNVLGGYDYPYQINMILSRFGFTKDEYIRKINTFSGGEKTRVAFSKLLLLKPELLILDEPTNHLDIEIIDWLEDYLNKYEGALLIVTHDKYFISKVCKKIIEIENHTIETYYGTFDEYEDERIRRYEILIRSYSRQQKEIAHLQSFIDRFRYNSKKASLAKDRQKKIDRIDKIDKPHLSKRKVKMNLEQKRATVEVILKAKNLSIGYDKPLIENIDFSMRGFDKLAIVGPNGTGKTTLLKAIEKKLLPLKGRVEFLREYKIGYFDQNQETLHYSKSIYEEIHDNYPMFTNKDVRSVAARFLFFAEDLDKPISILSGGEKVRLVLLLLMLEEPELLILDEPTNHLDIETKDIIEDVLNEFTGPIIFVSHDRYFINKIANKLVHLSTDEAIEFEGTYDEFKDQEIKQKKIKTKTKKNKTKKINYPKELSLLEKSIEKLSLKIDGLKEDTFKEENYTNGKKMNDLNKQIDLLEQDLHRIEHDYIDLLEESEREEV